MAAELENLDDLVRRHCPDRWLASRFISNVKARADVMALYAFDTELSRIPEVTSDPLTAEIRLTWWSEVIDEIYDDKPVRRHPISLALADVIKRHNLPKEQFEAILEPRFADPASAQNGPLMRLAVYILCHEWHLTGAAAEAWAHHSPDDLVEANTYLADLPSKAFPAVAYATLARLPKNASPLARRWRLFWAVMRGKL